MFHQYEVQIAAAQDKGSRVDMEGDINSPAESCFSELSWQEQIVGACRHTCNTGRRTPGHDRSLQVFICLVSPMLMGVNSN